MFSTVKKTARRFLAHNQRRAYTRTNARYQDDLTFTQAVQHFPDRDELYRYMHHYLHNVAPPELRAHRAYFSQERRGFGEDAFHAMWFTLLREFRPHNCLEIGVYRGQTISLWALVSRLTGFDCDLSGISPFSSAGDETSVYMSQVDYLTDTKQSFAKFSDSTPHLLKAFSTQDIAKDYIASRAWDLVYIDGNHDYEVALSDYEVCRDHLAPGGLLVLDDSSLYTDYHAPLFAFPGHPGPSRVLRDFATNELQFVGAVGHNNVLRKRS
jgi:hypothetical protein